MINTIKIENEYDDKMK